MQEICKFSDYQYTVPSANPIPNATSIHSAPGCNLLKINVGRSTPNILHMQRHYITPFTLLTGGLMEWTYTPQQ